MLRWIGRRDATVVAEAEVAAPDFVLVGERAQLGEHLRFAARRRQPQLAGGPDRLRDRLVGQVVEAIAADGRQHLREFVAARAEVSVEESIVTGEWVGQGWA
jgi:hypothetical protein